MKIIIAGAGEVGFHLAKLLSYESQEITLLDTKKESLVYAIDHLDIRVIKGDATSIAVLTLVSSVFAWGYVQVDGYTKSNGTYVAPHYRTTPDAYEWNNLSY